MRDQDELTELLKEVHRIEVQSNRLVNGVMAGSYQSVFRGFGIEFEEVREYVEGDDPRTVDWNVTARVGRPYVKTYVDEREMPMLFLLDLSASMTGGYGFWSARQVAARACACLALAAVKNHDKVGLIAFSDTVETYLRPKHSVGHALRIVRDCLALPGHHTTTDMVPALRLASRIARGHAIVFVVSDFLTSGWRQALTLMAKRHDVVAMRLLFPELTAPSGAMLRMQDPETGRQRSVDWQNSRVRKEYQRRVEEWDRRTIEDLRRAGVDRMDIPVPRERDRNVVARSLLQFFRMRQMRGLRR